MDKTVKVTEARTRFAELVDQVRYQGDTVTLIKSGKPAAVIVPVELFEQWKRERQGALNAMRRIQQNVTDDLAEEEAMTLAREAQQATRAQGKQS